jgi:hypothetical protein
MTSVQIPFIEFTNNRIQKSSIIIDNNQFNVEFKDGKYVVSKGNTMSKSSSPAQQTDMKSSPAPAPGPAPAPAKNANEKPKETKSTKSVAQTNDKSETKKTDTRPDPKPLKSVSNTKNEPIKKELTDEEIMMQDLFKAIALRRKIVDEKEKTEKVQEEGEKGAKVEQVQKEKKEEAKPTESKYEKYNQMKKKGLPEGAIRQKMTQDGIEEKEINDYLKSQEYEDIKPSTN